MFILNLLKQQGRVRPRMNFMQTRYMGKFKDGTEHASLNDLPLPEGDWKKDYDSKNSRYWMVLLSSITAFIATVTFVANGEMEFNYSVPEYPYDDEKH